MRPGSGGKPEHSPISGTYATAAGRQAVGATPARGTLVVRADAGPGHGNGHVLRQLALAQTWSESGGRVTLVSVRLPPPLAARWRDEGAEIIDLGDCSVGRLADIATERSAVWVSLDGYHLGGAPSALRDAGLRVLVVDDHGTMADASADVLVDQNVGASAAAYVMAAPGALLLGTRYALVRRAFRSAAAFRRAIPERPERALLTLGGMPPRLTLNLLRDALEAALPSVDVVELVGEPSDERIVDILSRSDLAVAGAGSTAWELCLMQVPTAYVVLADNQRPIARRLSGLGCGIDLGDASSLDARQVIEELGGLMDPAARASMARRSGRLVDGRGASRVLAALDAELLTLRRASAEEAEVVCTSSGDAANIARGTVVLIVSQPGNDPLGQARFDAVCDGQFDAMISLSLQSSAQEWGLGAAVIRAAVRKYRTEAGEARIGARVDATDLDTIAAFDLAAFAFDVTRSNNDEVVLTADPTSGTTDPLVGAAVDSPDWIRQVTAGTTGQPGERDRARWS